MKVFADDYNESPQTNLSIIELARLGHLSHVSCLAPPQDLDLEILKYPVRLGLHFYLTDFPTQTEPSLLSFEELRSELKAQLKHFTSFYQRPPCYLDGHRHIQSYPWIMTVLKELAREESIPLRATYPHQDHLRLFWQKSDWHSLIKTLSFRILYHLCPSSPEIEINQTSAPHYSLSKSDSFEICLIEFLKGELGDSFILHPGAEGWKRREVEIFLKHLSRDGVLKRLHQGFRRSKHRSS